MDDYNPLTWQEDEGLFCLVREQHGRICRVYGPFDVEEAVHAGWVWGVPFRIEVQADVVTAK